MLGTLLMLAQESASGSNAFFNLRNLILAACIVVLLVVLRVYRNKKMS